MSTPNSNPRPVPILTPRPTPSSELMRGVAGESSRVLSAHSRHFLALSLLFLLPLASLLLSLPSLLPSSLLNPNSNPSPSTPPQTLLRHSSVSPPFLAIVVVVVVLLLLLLLSAAAASTISHSVRSGFFGRPVRLITSLSALPSALLRLLLTLPLLLAYPLLFSIPTVLAHLFGFSLFFGLVTFLCGIAFGLSAPFLSLALSVAALEPSSYGLKPLCRSAALVKSVKPVAVWRDFLFFCAIALALCGCSLGEVGKVDGWREAVPVVVRTVFGLAMMTVLFLFWTVCSVVMYLYCRAVQGELVEEIAEEFAWEYVCLPFDEGKVPHVISVVRQ